MPRAGLRRCPTWSALPRPILTRPAAVGRQPQGTASRTAKGVDLTWTAPADYGANDSGPYTCVSYDLRYSSSPIDESNFAAATPVTGLPAPKAPGQAETLHRDRARTAARSYYFAIKSSDEAVPANVSEISNCAAAKSSVMGEKVLQDGLNGYNGTIDNYVESGNHTTQVRHLRADARGRLRGSE